MTETSARKPYQFKLLSISPQTCASSCSSDTQALVPVVNLAEMLGVLMCYGSRKLQSPLEQLEYRQPVGFGDFRL